MCTWYILVIALSPCHSISFNLYSNLMREGKWSIFSTCRWGSLRSSRLINLQRYTASKWGSGDSNPLLSDAQPRCFLYNGIISSIRIGWLNRSEMTLIFQDRYNTNTPSYEVKLAFISGNIQSTYKLCFLGHQVIMKSLYTFSVLKFS